MVKCINPWLTLAVVFACLTFSGVFTRERERKAFARAVLETRFYVSEKVVYNYKVHFSKKMS